MIVAVNAIASAQDNVPAEPLWRSVEREEVCPRSNSY
jgi:hypothetical protein